ncbi:MAG: hypothetical protein K2L87_02990, partial [Clostridiales bacterium]|nr:hypothetical protein [Clostridiales bacterium]
DPPPTTPPAPPLATAHFFFLPLTAYEIVCAYTDLTYEIKGGKLHIPAQGNYKAGAFYLMKR